MARARLSIVLLLVLLQGGSPLPISHAEPATPEAPSFTFNVNRTVDRRDANPGDGLCDINLGVAGQQCSLRAAIEEANATVGPDRINLQAQTYTLTLTGPDENAAASGDLDIRRNVTIVGVNSNQTVIDGNGIDRVFHITQPRAVILSNVGIRNGAGVAEGGGILNEGGTLRVEFAIIRDNASTGGGGGIFTRGGSLNLTGSIVTSNESGNGGGIAIDEGAATVAAIVSDNTASDSGGGVFMRGGALGDPAPPGASLTLDRSIVTRNTAADLGGGILSENGGNLTDLGSITSANSALYGGGIALVGSTMTGDGTLVSGNTATVEGGGFLGVGSAITLTTGRITENTAGRGAGAYLVGGTLALEASELAKNTASGEGGGVFSLGATVSLAQGSLVVENSADVGGGLRNAGGTLRIEGSYVRANVARAHGGISAEGGSVDITTSEINANQATFGRAGGISSLRSPITITFTVLISNTAAGSTGAIAVHDTQLRMTGSKLLSNRANEDGGGLALEDGATAIVASSTIVGNSAANGNGGGFDNQGGTLTISGSTVSENSARRGRGGAIYNAESVVITGSAVISNSAITGGGIYNAAAEAGEGGINNVVVTNSTLSGNRTTTSGGAIFSGGRLELSSATIARNTARVAGGGVHNSGGLTIFRNTLIGENVDSSDLGGRVPDCSGALASEDYNLVANATGCGISGLTAHNKIGVAPLLGALRDNGGPTLTHALRRNVFRKGSSPAIDGGNPGGCAAPPGGILTTDQRGRPRPEDGNGDDVAVCDIGAFEATRVGFVGTSELAPTEGSSTVGEPQPFVLTWTHPDRWRELHDLELIFVRPPITPSEEVSDDDVALWVRFTEGMTSTFSLLDANGEVVEVAEVGAGGTLENERAALHLEQSGFQADGPDDPSVVVTFTVSFKQPAAGELYSMLLVARDDLGGEQGPEEAGTWGVRAFALHLPFVVREE